MYFGLIVPAYSKSKAAMTSSIANNHLRIVTGYAYFAPTIIKSYGYDCMIPHLSKTYFR
jgi:uncharacterized membrane protein